MHLSDFFGRRLGGAIDQQRAMAYMRREHAKWVQSADLGVWWTVKPVGEDRGTGVPEGQGDPYYERHNFVKRAQPWPYPTKCLITDTGRVSWDIWWSIGGTGFTQERGHRKTYPEIMAEYEAIFERDSARMTRELAERMERERAQYRAPVRVR